MQPDVDTPATTTVSTPAACSVAASEVPKNAAGVLLDHHRLARGRAPARARPSRRRRPRRTRRARAPCARTGRRRRGRWCSARPSTPPGGRAARAASTSALGRGDRGRGVGQQERPARLGVGAARGRPPRTRRRAAPPDPPGERAVARSRWPGTPMHRGRRTARTRHAHTGRFGAGRPVSSSQRSSSSSIGGPMSNTGSSAGPARAQLGRAAPPSPRRRPRRRRRPPRRSGGRPRRVTSPRRTSSATSAGSRSSGSPQPPPPQVTKCSTSPAAHRHVVALATAAPRGRRRPARPTCVPRAPGRAAVDAPRVGEPAVVVDRDLARLLEARRPRRRRCRRGAARRRRCRRRSPTSRCAAGSRTPGTRTGC